MLRKRSIQLTLLVVILIAAAVAVILQKEIRIAYHTNQLRSWARYYMVETGQGPRVSFLEDRLARLGRGNWEQEQESMRRHTQALMDLSYFVREELPLTNRLYIGTNGFLFHQLMTNRIDFGNTEALKGDWWDLTGTESNKIVVTTTKALMPRWKKLVEDFDRP